MKHLITYFSVLFFLISYLGAQVNQDIVNGMVTDEKQGQNHPLAGANVYWLNTQTGATTSPDGKFSLVRPENVTKLVISYIGYHNDTVETGENHYFRITLKESLELEEVEIVHRKKGTEISMLDPLKVEKIGEKELLKAACCNLSESFETNPSVDVSFTDAVTGTRQIQMLGLAGPYTQITRENMPDIRGLSSIYGLTFIPGTWIESIHLNKGTGSVVNGYESIAGQIDVNLRRHETMDRYYLNVFANEEGRVEVNANIRGQMNDHWGTGLLLHVKNNNVKMDRNDDGFLDSPTGSQYIAMNRWELHNGHGLHFEVGAKGTYVNNIGGETTFNLKNDEGTLNRWGMHMQVKKAEGWAKLGKVNEEKPWQSIGLQLSGSVHDQHSYFGTKKYEAFQTSLYSNLIFQGIIGNTNHKYRTGASFQNDKYDEMLNIASYNRNETVPGAFFEYTYNDTDKFTIVAGIRGDYHNVYGFFTTPRLHLRYQFTENTVIRASGGRGQRTASIISENSGILASSRNFTIIGDGSNKPYGLDAETAWNYGANFTQKFRIDYRQGAFSVDFYRTDFVNQVVVDLDANPQEVRFYNLDGKSFSNSFQAQLDYELVKRFDMRLAYRWYDVKTSFVNGLMLKPLTSKNRAFINLAYETRGHWKFDYTINWQGEKRLPDTQSNPEEYRLPAYSPDFYLMNAQVSKIWREKLDVYVGIENIMDFKQKNPILASDLPFSDYFDASMIWGPVFGRMVYAGIRLKIK